MFNVEDKDQSKQKRKKNRDKLSGIEENILKNPFMTSERSTVSRQIL